MQKSDRGITLIALVVTIIVLIILAGVSINILIGENGIINKAIDAKKKTEQAANEEKESLNEIESYFITKVEDETPGDITDGGLQDGSKEKPYKIRSVEDFLEMVSITRSNGTYDKYIDLECNLDFKNPDSYMNPNDTETFGDYNEDEKTEGIMKELTNENGRGLKKGFEFNGILDGKGYTISNIFMSDSLLYNATTPVDYDAGIFAKNKGIIKNLKVQGNMKISIDDNSVAAKIAGLVSENIEGGEIINCTSEMNIEVIGNNIVLFDATIIEVGGLVASNKNNAKIDKCIYEGNLQSNFNVNSSIDESYYHRIRIGGLIGNNEGIATNLINKGNLTTSKNFSTTVAAGDSSLNSGGIAGENSENGIIENCINLAKVDSSSETSELFVGGIVANSDDISSVKNVYNIGEIAANTTNNIAIGGILADGNGTLDYAFNIGILNANSSATIKKGSIIGDYHSSNTNITNCYYNKVDGIFGAEGKDVININSVENLSQTQVIQQLNTQVDNNNRIEGNRAWFKILEKSGTLEFET